MNWNTKHQLSVGENGNQFFLDESQQNSYERNSRGQQILNYYTDRRIPNNQERSLRLNDEIPENSNPRERNNHLKLAEMVK